ncbi:hypothetical protein N9D31_00705, partial [Oligoflexaceae bacterium]|nr:hypothetical protein [Oligoflexaceae bacterium]
MSHSDGFDFEVNDGSESEYLSEIENREGVEVLAPSDEPFEAPVKKIETGPLYADAAERMPEIAEAPVSEDELLSSLDDSSSELPVDRRNFMKLFGASAVFASTGCVRRPVEKALPYSDQPIDQVPGNEVHYATTCNDCASKCGLIVKTREGRPVKIEGARSHPLSQGATCALGQSSLQALFHPERRKKPAMKFGSR